MTFHSPSIIFTIGPSTCDEDILSSILSHNVSYVRFNMSHGSHDEHRLRLQNVRQLALSLKKDIKVIADLCGPKMRVTAINGEYMEIASQAEIRIVANPEDVHSYENALAISFSNLHAHVKPDTKIALDDGKILLSVARIEGSIIVLSVIRGGRLINEKGVNVIDTDLPIESFTEKDKADALFAVQEKFDALALSFVKRKEDIASLRDFLKSNADLTLPVIAKIETRQALHDIDGILESADMIMVARGDLGIEIPQEKIPIVQKELLFLSKRKGVPAIVATEMLKSMTNSPFPTRAEISDCIGALMDGASYIMLSDETTIGKYPAQAVRVMSSVIEEFVENQNKYSFFEKN